VERAQGVRIVRQALGLITRFLEAVEGDESCAASG